MNVDSKKSEIAEKRPVVVGIGASAGGLEAISQLLKGIPEDSGMSYVIVQHLDPTHKSSLVEILQRRTSLAVQQVDEDTAVKRNHVYVIPPGQYLSIESCILKLSEPQDPRGSRMAIDYFLTSLAEDSCEFGIGIILSGTGSDGTAGLQEIKHYGGLTVVQDPDEAEHTGMPQSAIDAVHVDYVLPAKQIGSQLKRYVEFCQTHGPLSAQSVAQAEQSDLTPILDILRKKLKHDFRRYRKNTLMRRIQRRMGLHQLDQLSDYQAFLADSEKERDALRCDLLIGVTRFFRNPEAWKELEEKVVRPMLAPERREPVRVWCAGCATGEEAYSIAMLLLEQVGTDRRKLPFQIFATDVADDALAFARTGLYPEAIMKDVPLERLRRFFKKEGSGYRVSKQLREAVVFANQNVLAQPPFAKLDLILCRNLLIYLQREAQDRVMNVFQFALKEGGVLFQGSSESVGKSSDLYTTVSKKHRIYRRNELKAWPPAGGEYQANIQPLPNFSARERKTQRNHHHVDGIAAVAQRHLLQRLGYGVIIVNGDNRLLYAEGEADAYIQFGMGELSPELPDVMEIARKGLKAKLRASLRKIWNGHASLEVEARVKRDGAFHPCEMQLSRMPGRSDDDPAAMVIFTPIQKAKRVTTPTTTEETDASQSQSDKESKSIAAEQALMEVEQELLITRDQLNSSISDMESANEELKAANEEAMTMSEELQSSNEELETSKEELQSLNEELTTLNNQLEIKVDELEDTTNDLQNLLTSTDIPTVFLDTQFRIRRYTPSCDELFHFIAGDVGRPLDDIKAYFDDPDLLGDAKKVLRDLQPREKQVASIDGERRYRRRMLPYRTEDNRIQGVVMTMTDITELLNAQEQAQHQLAENQVIYATTPVGLAYVDTELTYLSINEQLAAINGKPVEEHLGKTIDDILPAELAKQVRVFYRQVLGTRKGIFNLEVFGKTAAADEEHTYLVSYVPVQNEDGQMLGVNTVVQDITERKRIEQELAASKNQLQKITDAIPPLISFVDQDYRYSFVNAAYAKLFDRPIAEIVGRKVQEIVGDDNFSRIHPHLEKGLGGERNTSDIVFRMPDSDVVLHKEATYIPETNSDGTVAGVHVVVNDVTERRRHEVERAERHEQLQLALSAGQLGSWEWDIGNDTVQWSPQLYEIFGCTKEQFDGTLECFLAIVHPDDRQRVGQLIQNRLASDETFYDIECRIVRPQDGRTVWTHGLGNIQRDKNGNPLRIIGIASDITEQKRRGSDLNFLADLQNAFNPLQSSEDLLRVACQRTAEYLDLSHCCFVEIDAEASVADVICDHVANDAPSLVGRHAIDEYHTPQQRQALVEGDVVTINDTQTDVEDLQQRDNFATLGIAAACHCAFVSGGQIKFSLSSAKEQPHQWTAEEIQLLKSVTQRLCTRVERARAEEDLADAKARLELSLEVGDIVPWNLDVRTAELAANPILNRLFGYDADAKPSLDDLSQRIHPADRQRVTDSVRRATQNGEVIDEEYAIVLPGGERRYVRGRGGVRKSSTGEVREFFGVNVDITARKQQEIELADREAHLRGVIDSAFTFLGVMSADGVVSDLNKMSLNAIGMKREEAVGVIFWELPCWSYDPEVAAAIKKTVSQCVETGEPVPFRSNYQAGDKTVRFCDAAIGPIKDENGRVVEVVASGSDVTEQHATQVALATSRSRLKTAMRAARMGSFVWDRVTDDAIWDEEWKDAVGVHDVKEKKGKVFFEMLHPDDLECVKKSTQDSFEGKCEYKCEFRIIRPDGVVRWLAGVGDWVKDEDGKPRKLAGINWDITEQKLAEQEIRLNEERLRVAAGAAGFGVFHVDLDDDQVFWSDEFKRLVGLKLNDSTKVSMRDLPEFIHPDDQMKAKRHVEKILADLDEPDHWITHRIIKGNEVRWVRMQTRSLYEGDGDLKRIKMIVGTLLDITAQHESEQKLAKAKRQAEAASKSKSAFLANMSHEIRTPMTAIMGYTDLLKERLSDDESRGYLNTINRNGNYLLEIINDILDLSKIEAQKFEIDVERFNPARLVEDVRSIMDVRAREGGIELNIDYATAIPAVIESDSKRLKQILINLVGNAIKFTMKGGVKIRVEYRDRMLKFAVSDTGIGMTEEQSDRLFKPFSQGDSQITQQFGGTGLGLAISGRLAAMLGGEISCNSELKHGSTFTVTINIGNMEEVDLVTPEVSFTETTNDETVVDDICVDANILIVDDRRDIRFLTKHILTQVGASITEAEDGVIAIETVKQAAADNTSFDLILLDMQMPNMDGYETAAALRKLGYSGPIIALTADAMQGDMSKCLKAGCNDYLSKPIDAQEMLRLVGELTEKK